MKKISDLAMAVEIRHGPVAGSGFARALRSFAERRMYFDYHWRAARSRESIGRDGKSEADRFAWVLGGDDEAEKSYPETKLKFMAHATAAVQDLHAMADLCGHAVFFGTGLLKTAPGLERRYAHEVAAELDRQGEPRLASLLSALTGLPEYVQLSAISNMAKHRTVISAQFHLLRDGKPCSEFVFEAFEYRNQRFPLTPVISFLQRVHDSQMPLYGQIFETFENPES